MPENNENATEQHESDLIALSLLLLRYQAELTRQVEAMLKELQTELIVEFTRSEIMGSNTYLTKLRRLERYLRTIRSTISERYTALAASQRTELVRLANVEVNGVLRSINGIVQAPVANTTLTAERIREIVDSVSAEGAPVAELWNRQAEDTYRRVADKVRLGVMNDQTKGQIEEAITGTKEANYADGALKQPARHAETIARTAANIVANDTRAAIYEANPELIKSILWQSIIDGRTSNICLALHLKQWTFPDYKPIKHDKAFPGAAPHFNCRSSQVAIFKTWDELKVARITTAAGGTTTLESIAQKSWKERGLADDVIADIKASLNAAAPTPKTFDQWLAKQSAAYQNELLGPGRAAMFRDGQITMSDLTDKTSRPLTIIELEDRLNP